LTSSGFEVAKRLDNDNRTGREGGTGVRKSGLSREIKKELSDLIGSRAVRKVDNEQFEDVSFQDACMFWGINPRSKAIELEGQLSHFQSLIAAAIDEVKCGEISMEHGGSSFGQKTLDLLLQTDNFLKDRFQEDLDVIRARTDQRKR